jgi:hypothetical protein
VVSFGLRLASIVTALLLHLHHHPSSPPVVVGYIFILSTSDSLKDPHLLPLPPLPEIEHWFGASIRDHLVINNIITL